ncbi:MAG: glutamyl-tRNA reductase [Chloroflexi bacterium]|nr:glutamyl-tRNA reductase [Chloroflexota bacterium]
MKREALVVTCVGLNHRTAPVEEREKVAFSADDLPDALNRLHGELGSAVIISTCNRTELYATTAGGAHDADRLLDALAACKGTVLHPRLTYFLSHDEAARHLFRVAAGIDSMVLGESQILGQVRDAMSAATLAGSLNGVLSRLCHSALRVGKRARSQTNIGRYAVSVSSAAVALAKQTVGTLEGKTVLVISAGSTGELAANSLAESGAERILVTNRTPQRAAALARKIGGETVPFSRLPRALAQSDIVISGTGAGEFILGLETVASAAAKRNGNDLLLLDVAVPRDIDPAVRELPGVRLFDIDDIEAVSRANLRGRRREVLRVEAHVEDEVEDFMNWWRSLDVVPVIAALRERAEGIRGRELERALRRLPGLDDEQRERIEAMTCAIVKKMLDRPIARLKDGVDTGLYMEALEDLFEVRSSPSRKRR